jgi:hypothetical protein
MYKRTNNDLQNIHKKDTTYDVANPGSGFEQAHKYDGLNRLMGSQPFPLYIMYVIYEDSLIYLL